MGPEGASVARKSHCGQLGLQDIMQRRQPVVPGMHPDPKDTWAAKMWETAEVAEPAARRLRGAGGPADGRVDSSHIACVDVPEELQGQMHRFGLYPANFGTQGAELGDQSRELLLYVIRQIYGGEEAHGNDQDCIAFGSR